MANDRRRIDALQARWNWLYENVPEPESRAERALLLVERDALEMGDYEDAAWARQERAKQGMP